MKATKLLIAAAAFASFASLSIAGPSPEYWVRMNQKKPASNPTIRRPAETKAEPAAKPATEVPTACKGCQADKT